MRIEFTKMQATGNDYVYVNCMKYGELPFDPAALAGTASKRRYSIGADGLVLILRAENADARMRMFNADGSEGAMCGNAIRCVTRYLYERGIIPRLEMTIETASGPKKTRISPDGRVTVDMGRAELCGSIRAAIRGRAWDVTRISVGNPHAVCFFDGIDRLDLEKTGPAFEHSPIFGERVNAEFVEKAGDLRLRARVWERGSGETHACGTGACAAVAAAAEKGIIPAGREICVLMKGGELGVLYTPDRRLYLTGDAQTVYDGVFDYAEDKA